jgi:hypothetical protein
VTPFIEDTRGAESQSTVTPFIEDMRGAADGSDSAVSSDFKRGGEPQTSVATSTAANDSTSATNTDDPAVLSASSALPATAVYAGQHATASQVDRIRHGDAISAGSAQAVSQSSDVEDSNSDLRSLDSGLESDCRSGRRAIVVESPCRPAPKEEHALAALASLDSGGEDSSDGSGWVHVSHPTSASRRRLPRDSGESGTDNSEMIGPDGVL